MKYVIFLLTAAAVVLLSGCGQGAVPSQGGKVVETGGVAAGVKTVQVGDARVTWLQDVARKQSRGIFADASDALMDSLGLQDGVPSTISAFLVERDGEKMLFDTGLGRGRGRVLPLLDSLGVSAADVSRIYLTHLHGDHIGGMLDGDEVVFPKAEVYLAHAEYEGWMAMPEGQKAQAVQVTEAYAGRLHLFDFGDVLPGGVLSINAVGHTPGHTVFQLGRLLVVGDIIHGAALQLRYPDICPSFDMDKEAATASRKRILRYAEENGLLMAGMHLPAPAFLEGRE